MKIAPLVALAAFGGMALMLWMQDRQLRNLRTDLMHLKEDLTGTPADTTDFGGELRRSSDIAGRMAAVKADDLEDFAGALSEVDEWLFHPDDEKSAASTIETLVITLRIKIGSAINEDLAAALDSTTGRTASGYLSHAGVLFGLYPQPTSDEHKKEIEALSEQVTLTARRVEELRRLRYNQWVSSQVQKAFDGYYANKKTFGDDDDALIQSFVDNLGEVEASQLEPAVSGIFQQVLTLTTEAVAEPKRVDLAKKLSASTIQRKTPLDF